MTDSIPDIKLYSFELDHYNDAGNRVSYLLISKDNQLHHDERPAFPSECLYIERGDAYLKDKTSRGVYRKSSIENVTYHTSKINGEYFLEILIWVRSGSNIFVRTKVYDIHAVEIINPIINLIFN